MRRRFLSSMLLAAVLTLSAAVPAAATDRDVSPHGGGVQLALGDSVAFGYSPLLDHRVASNFVGYPETAAGRLGLIDVNESCPGEATGGFLSLIGTDNGCRPYRLLYPLHVHYAGTQMDFAIDYLRSHQNVRLVTIDLGANDVFFLRNVCSHATDPAGCAADRRKLGDWSHHTWSDIRRPPT